MLQPGKQLRQAQSFIWVRGMQMSGVNGWNQFTGIQSLNTFAPPFTFETTVTGTVANGNPFEIYFISADGRQVFSVYGNVNPTNVPYVGIKVGCQVIYATPNANVALYNRYQRNRGRSTSESHCEPARQY